MGKNAFFQFLNVEGLILKNLIKKIPYHKFFLKKKLI